MNNFDAGSQSVNEKNKNNVVKANLRNMTEKEIKEYIGFAKFKKRLLTVRLVKTILATLSFAFIACGVMLIITKLDVWDISPWFSLLFGLVAGAITFPCVFLPLSFTDKKLAYRLDEKFSLKERMHTSLENLDNNSPMSILLRQDLKKKTEQIEASKIKAKGLPVYIAVAVVALATLITGLAIRQEKPEPPSPPPPQESWTLSAEQESAIKEIIATVEASNMVSPAKEELVVKMNSLLVELKEKSKYQDACKLVEDYASEMDDITYKTGSSGALYYAIKAKNTPFTRELARMLTKTDKTKYESKLCDAIDSLKHKYSELPEVTDEQREQMKSETISVLAFATIDVLSALDESGVDPSDELYNCLYSLITMNKNSKYGIGIIGEKMETFNYGWAELQLEGLKDSALKNNIYTELSKQNENYSVGYGASDGLRELFEIDVPVREDMTEESSGENSEDKETEEDEDKNAAGGYGPGLILGTDELVYDRENGQTIITQELYQKYKKIMGDHFTEIVDGKETIPTAIDMYFKLLLNGYEEGEE